jgi:hypothetical protein
MAISAENSPMHCAVLVLAPSKKLFLKNQAKEIKTFPWDLVAALRF